MSNGFPLIINSRWGNNNNLEHFNLLMQGFGSCSLSDTIDKWSAKAVAWVLWCWRANVTSNSLWWLEITLGQMLKNSSFLLKAHSAQWDTFVWTWYINGFCTLFTLEIHCDSCHCKLHTPTPLWLLDGNLSGVIGLVCHLLLIIGKFFWIQHKNLKFPLHGHMF